MPVQRIVLNSALETTIEAAVESPRATISEKIRVRMTYRTVSCFLGVQRGSIRVQRGSVGCSVAQ